MAASLLSSQALVLTDSLSKKQSLVARARSQEENQSPSTDHRPPPTPTPRAFSVSTLRLLPSYKDTVMVFSVHLGRIILSLQLHRPLFQIWAHLSFLWQVFPFGLLLFSFSGASISQILNHQNWLLEFLTSNYCCSSLGNFSWCYLPTLLSNISMSFIMFLNSFIEVYSKKQESSRNTSISASLTMPKPWLSGSQHITENSSRDRNTRPSYLPPEKSVCRWRNNS